jgi:hypothetical protein
MANRYDLGDRPVWRVTFRNKPTYPEVVGALMTPTTREAFYRRPNTSTWVSLGAGTAVAEGVVEWELPVLDESEGWTVRATATAPFQTAVREELIVRRD